MNNTRLETIFSWIDKNLKVADIGSDHGKLAIELSKISDHVYATEYNPQPYLRLLENINRSKKINITVLKGDGFLPLIDYHFDIGVIAGMGGNTIVEIMEKATSKTVMPSQIIIAPQNNVEKTRLFFKKNNFSIVKEIILKEKGVYYNIIKAEKSKTSNILNDQDILFGPLFIKNNINLEYVNIKYLELKNINKHRKNKQIQNNLSIIEKLIKSW